MFNSLCWWCRVCQDLFSGRYGNPSTNLTMTQSQHTLSNCSSPGKSGGNLNVRLHNRQNQRPRGTTIPRPRIDTEIFLGEIMVSPLS
ncbi:MAG: hypothetical protein [Circular genetic element sp.]|nr:MAG: hypothetical protein [Circular genetic element sp.]